MGEVFSTGERYEGQQIVEVAVEVSFAQGPANAIRFSSVLWAVAGCR